MEGSGVGGAREVEVADVAEGHGVELVVEEARGEDLLDALESRGWTTHR